MDKTKLLFSYYLEPIFLREFYYSQREGDEGTFTNFSGYSRGYAIALKIKKKYT